MTIELTAEQAAALAAGEGLVVVDPRTKQASRLVREDATKAPPYDGSPWTPTETGLLAGEALSKLDDPDYSGYPGEKP